MATTPRTAVSLEDWPLRRFNLFAIPIAIALAVFGNSFGPSFGIAVVAGLIIAGVMAILYVRRLKEQVAAANPLQRFSAEIQGATDTSLHVRFILMTSLSGGLIIAIWFAIASGMAFLLR